MEHPPELGSQQIHAKKMGLQQDWCQKNSKKHRVELGLNTELWNSNQEFFGENQQYFFEW